MIECRAQRPSTAGMRYSFSDSMTNRRQTHLHPAMRGQLRLSLTGGAVWGDKCVNVVIGS